MKTDDYIKNKADKLKEISGVKLKVPFSQQYFDVY